MSFGESYSLRKITNWLKENNLNDYAYTQNGGDLFFSMYSTGIRVKLNDTYSISIQTNPVIAGPAFCETMLINNISKKLEYNNNLGYSDVIRHMEQNDVFDHITELKNKLSENK